MRSLFLIAIYIFFSFLSLQLHGQAKEWNLTLDKETNSSNANKVMETDSFYYVAGRSGNFNYGFTVYKISKLDGTTVSYVHYEEAGVNMDFNTTQEWYLEGDKILFPIKTLLPLPAYINLFSVDIHTLVIEKIAAIPVPDERSEFTMFLYDFKKIEDNYYILSHCYIELSSTDYEYYPMLVRYNPISKEYKYILLGDGKVIYDLHEMIGLNGYIYVFASLANENYIAEAKQVIYCLNLEGEQLWKHITSQYSQIYYVCDVYPLNEHEVLLVSKDNRFLYSDRNLWPRWRVTRYDLETNKEVWSTYWDEPRKDYFWHLARIVPTKVPGEYLLMASDRVSASTENYTTGKVVRFTDEGKRLWQKTYYYKNSVWGLINDFFSMIPTSDGNYLIGGWVNWGGGRPWLVKIDDDGNILPTDTTTSVQDIQVELNEVPTVEIYPNPASNVLTINIAGGDEAIGYQAIVTGADGKIVSVYAIGGQSTTVDVSGYVPGIYTVQVEHHGKMIYVTKFIKIK